jgi:two-component system chemotaxis response regulator CheY
MMRALIVDDSSVLRALVGRMLREAGYQVSEASTGDEALQVLQRDGIPEVVLVDWNMPVMNGLDFVRVVRRELGDREVVLMMVTSETESSQVARALAAGANEYLMKPFTWEALAEKLELLGIGPAR